MQGKNLCQQGLNLNKAKELGTWLHERINELILPADNRVRIGGALLHLAQEHYNAINLLIEAQHYGSAFALARPLFEAYVRSLWILDCTLETQQKEYMKGIIPCINTLLNDIENTPETNGAGIWLKKIKETNIKQFHDLTHGGACQVIRRNTEEGIESNYSKEERIKLLKYSGEVAIQTATKFFIIADEELLLTELKEKAATIRQFWIEN